MMTCIESLRPIVPSLTHRLRCADCLSVRCSRCTIPLEHPQKVGALCLIAPQYRMPKRLMVMQDFIFRLLPASAFEETGLDRQQMCRLTRSMMQLDFTRKLQQIDIPVRILCGEKDRANQKAAQELASRVKTAELHWIAGVGHEVNEQAPARLAAALTDFLNSVG